MSVVDQIKERLDIVEVIGRQVQLQRAGRNLKAVCPFHTEKTPSFFVFPDNQRWHCFGCGRGGDVFSFLMELQGWDFRTALEELGRQTGVEIRPRTPEQLEAEAENERLQRAVAAAAEYFHALLLSAPQAQTAREYLTRRGFTPATIEQFQLGYSLESWDALRTHLLGQGYTIAELVKAGLLVQKDDGGTYDRFRDRVMIPICNRRGEVIAFGSRVLTPEAQPKYMNSPQTPLFDKGRILFGAHLAAQAIRQADAVIIVEGYMDVMILQQEGYANVVAPMGTALTESHLQQLHRLTQRFILALDPDPAGIHATMRGLDVARETLGRRGSAIFDPRGLVGYQGKLNVDIRAIQLPDGLDPDELILEDRARWDALVTTSEPVIRFYFQQLLQQHEPEEPRGKAQIIDAMLPLLQDLSDGIEREAYAREISQRLGLDERSLLDRLRARERATAIQTRVAVKPPGHTLRSANLEVYILTLLLHYPELQAQTTKILQELNLPPLRAGDFSPSYRLIWESWLELQSDPEQEWEQLLPTDLLSEVNEWRTQLLPEASLEQLGRDLLRALLRLRETQLRQEIAEVQDLLLQARTADDLRGSAYAPIMQDLNTRLRQVQWALHKGNG